MDPRTPRWGVKCCEGQAGYKEAGHHSWHISDQTALHCSLKIKSCPCLGLWGTGGQSHRSLTHCRGYQGVWERRRKHTVLSSLQEAVCGWCSHLFSEEEVKAKRAHKLNSASSEQFRLVWTTAVATPPHKLPVCSRSGKNCYYWSINHHQMELQKIDTKTRIKKTKLFFERFRIIKCQCSLTV